ncbi:hypothetical protein [Morganella morganii]|uniref:hypothetical protein n=1 Tax=Morganella morganii TaxID=582 RepID=UPI003EBB190E
MNQAAVTLVASAPSLSSSGITVGKSSYISGSDIAVTVTLKDAQCNAVLRQASALAVQGVVDVPNTVVKLDHGIRISTVWHYRWVVGTGKYRCCDGQEYICSR